MDYKIVKEVTHMKYYCPKCYEELEEESACGSVSYFCPECKGLVSRSKILSEDQKELLDQDKS